MFRKLNIKVLGVVFLCLLSVSVIVKVIDNTRGINTLKNELFTIEHDEVMSVLLQPKVLNGKIVELKKEGEGWSVKFEGKSYNGDANVIEGLIRQVNGLKPLRLAAQSKDRWERFELTDSLSTKVTLNDAEGELAKLYIGKFSYQQPKQNSMMQQNPYMQQRGTMTTYVRSGEDKEVYAVEGFLGGSVNRNADAFRDKTVINADKASINKVDFVSPESSFTMVKNENTWVVEGTALDSTAVANYLSGIVRLKGSSFTDTKPQSFTYKVTVYTDKGENIEVKGVLQDKDAVIVSSQNTGTVFKENKERIFEKLFVSKESFE